MLASSCCQSVSTMVDTNLFAFCVTLSTRVEPNPQRENPPPLLPLPLRLQGRHFLCYKIDVALVSLQRVDNTHVSYRMARLIIMFRPENCKGIRRAASRVRLWA
jgi:hypothetical protein